MTPNRKCWRTNEPSGSEKQTNFAEFDQLHGIAPEAIIMSTAIAGNHRDH
jgi:hypothetical protein